MKYSVCTVPYFIHFHFFLFSSTRCLVTPGAPFSELVVQDNQERAKKANAIAECLKGLDKAKKKKAEKEKKAAEKAEKAAQKAAEKQRKVEAAIAEKNRKALEKAKERQRKEAQKKARGRPTKRKEWAFQENLQASRRTAKAPQKPDSDAGKIKILFFYQGKH